MPLLQYILFTVLIIATPFVVVTKFMQGSINYISHLKWSLFGLQLPVAATIVIIGFIGFLIWQRKNISLRRILCSFVVLLMMVLAHQAQDLYLGMAIYDLQMNWHYAAYAAYVYMFFRAFRTRGLSTAGMIVIAFFSSLAISTIDELFQYNLSHRIFDVSDIAKDAYGAMIGLVLILFVSETYGTVNFHDQKLTLPKIKAIFLNPVQALQVTAIFSTILILLSPLLTEHKYISLIVIISICSFITVMALLHLSRIKLVRYSLIGLICLTLLTLTVSFFVNRSRNLCYVSPKLVVYKGLPVPFFDIMIFPDGMMRLVDKKESFNDQDRRFLLKQKPDILLIGSGYNGEGGRGFQVQNSTGFIYNKHIGRGTQVIILKTPDACEVFNRLKNEGKNVLFIIHNSI
ncbi:VanZ family protein [bacterium]|nr:VanZ family protein [bacterium]